MEQFPSPERITKAAISFRGRLFTGTSHSEVIEQIEAEYGELLEKEYAEMTDGFLTSTNRFVTREEAGKLAAVAQQIVYDDAEDIADATASLTSDDVALGNDEVQ